MSMTSTTPFLLLCVVSIIFTTASGALSMTTTLSHTSLHLPSNVPSATSFSVVVSDGTVSRWQQEPKTRLTLVSSPRDVLISPQRGVTGSESIRVQIDDTEGDDDNTVISVRYSAITTLVLRTTCDTQSLHVEDACTLQCDAMDANGVSFTRWPGDGIDVELSSPGVLSETSESVYRAVASGNVTARCLVRISVTSEEN
eukprot:PhM_4_TR16734/c0_g1_i2/m.30483